jgi:radical SAM superfamily enzyme YgiQ (UPF0313 family)
MLRALLVSTYDLGRQPFGLASPAAWLRAAGTEVRVLDLAVQPFDEDAARAADLVAFHVPMHTATRLATRHAAAVRRLNPRAHLCFYGLYAPMNAAHLRSLGAHTLIGGEVEETLADLARSLAARKARGEPLDRPLPGVAGEGDAVVRLDRLAFRVPDRTGLPPLERYARLDVGDGRLRVVGSTEATRGCRHRCRHCPIVPVYGGRFRVVAPEVVLADVRQQVAAGAEHLTFADPDFLNGPRHALRLVEAVHREFPALTWDATIKVEHLLAHADRLTVLRERGCLFVTTAVESFDDRVLAILDKGHTRAGVERLAALARAAGLTLHPTFVAFHPWVGRAGYVEFLRAIEALDWVEHTASIQLGIRLLVPAGSRLLEREEARAVVGAFDPEALAHRWAHEDPAMDALQRAVQERIHADAGEGLGRAATFERVMRLAQDAAAGDALAAASDVAMAVVGGSARDGEIAPALARAARAPKRPPVPFLTEPWYC